MEWVDIVNEHGIVIGRQKRHPAMNWSTVRVVYGFVKNTEGKLWIPRRSRHKALFPDALDVSVGGCVQSGESYDQAFFRETKEELGFDLHTMNWYLLAAFALDEKLSSFMQVYEIQTDREPQAHPTEWSSAEWFSLAELQDRLLKDKVKPDLPEVLRHCYG